MKQENPFFSIIIPTYDRPRQLESCLESLTHLNYPRARFEVIIVNDGGGVLLEELIARFEDRLNVVLITQTNSGPSNARNNGAKIAKGRFLAFTDDDCQPDRNWLVSLENRLKNNPNCIIGGRTLNLLQDNVYSAASQMICELAYKYYNTDNNDAKFFSSNNIAISRKNFPEVRGFDETLRTAEDRDFCKRWVKLGHKMIFAAEAIIYHAHDLTMLTFIKQHFNYGLGSYKFYRKKSLHGTGYFSSL